MSSTVDRAVPTADELAEMVDRGESIAPYLSGKGKMVYPAEAHSVVLSLSLPMLEELDRAAQELAVSRQDLVKVTVRQWLDQHYLAAAAAERTRTVHPPETSPAVAA